MPSKQRFAVRSVQKPTTRTRPLMKKKKLVTFVPKLHSGEDEKALHYMFTYKIGTQRRHISIHRGLYNYGPTKCQEMFKTGRCPEGRRCRFAHNSLELLFHPLFYKTKECTAFQTGKCKQGADCAFAHNAEEKRAIMFDWRTKDPVSYGEKKQIWDKKAEKKSRKVRLRTRVAPAVGEDAKEEYVEEDESIPSVSSSRSRTPNSYATVTTEEAMSLSTSVSPVLKAADEAPVDVKEAEQEEPQPTTVSGDVDIRVGKESTTGREFEGWYRDTFNCEFLSYVHYLTRFQAKELDDVELLWDLYIDSRKKKNNAFVEMLANEISMVDERARNLFVRRLCEYKSPVDIRGWMERVVGLPQYADLFVASVGKNGRVDDLVHLGVDGDDVAEMGVSLVGHRMKILHQLKKFGEFDCDE